VAGVSVEWSFLRTAPDTIELFLRARHPRLLAAQLTGLALAAGVNPPIELPTTEPPYPVVAGATSVALEVMDMTPSWRARLGAAVDLAILATVDGRSSEHSEPAAAACLDRRWQRIASALTSRAHPLARWRCQLTELRGSDPDARAALRVLHVAHNQLGLREHDEQRVYSVLIRSLGPDSAAAPILRTDLSAPGARRVPGNVSAACGGMR
jgi:hypothetical protein